MGLLYWLIVLMMTLALIGCNSPEKEQLELDVKQLVQKCDNAYDCVAYVQIDKNIYVPTHSSILFADYEMMGRKLENVYDAEARYAYFLRNKYMGTMFNIVICECSSKTVIDYRNKQQLNAQKALQQYESYLNGDIKKPAFQSGYKLPM